jgi:2-amino-4-hydroxy-6-hydroxymethyldihydropteridine diphosphokinase
MVPVVIALGSNVGDSLGHMRQAIVALQATLSGMEPSRVYRTAPMYVTDQPAYLNAAVKGVTELGPLRLLKELKRIERDIGREARNRYGPREIDLDLVSYGSLAYTGAILQVPHPKSPERRFVLAPMADIDPDLRLSAIGTVRELLAQTECQAEDVVPIKDALFPIPGNR